MGLSTLNGHRVTSGRAFIPKWGCWHANVAIDGEHAIANGASVTLVMADLSLVGTVLSGGVALGRSFYRIVAGAGGWGREIAAASYPDDAGVKFATAIGHAANEVGETLATIAPSLRTGPNWTREAGPASLVLNSLAPAGWYVDEAGVTHVGERTAGTLPAKVTRIAPVDFARGKVVLASETIAAILPGVVVDGLTAVDVVHEVSAEGGLRSTVYGGPTGSAADSMRKLQAALDPDRLFRGPAEYRVDTISGSRLNLQPIDSRLPYLKYVPMRPGVSGCEAVVALSSLVVVWFLGGDPSRPFVAAFEDADGSGFQPTTLTIEAGGMAATEHFVTTEAMILFFYNYNVALMTAAGGGPLLAAVLQPLIVPALLAAAASQSAPAPPGLVAQTALNTTLTASMASGTTPSNAVGALSAALALLSTKTANASGFFPSVGCKAVKGS